MTSRASQRWNKSSRAPVLIADHAGDRPRGIGIQSRPMLEIAEAPMSQSMPVVGPGTPLSQPIESTVQLWIRIWQAQLIARSR
jgi:hypothetical protein